MSEQQDEHRMQRLYERARNLPSPSARKAIIAAGEEGDRYEADRLAEEATS